MTISSTTRIAGPFNGNGSTATFPFTFKVFAQTDLYVVTSTLATGIIAPLALTTDYTVTLNGDQDSDPGGSITLTAGNLASGVTLVITTDMAQLQNLDLTNGGAFYPDTINDALDTLVILIQQLALLLGRSLQVPLVDASPSVTLPPAAERAGKLLMFDANGNPSLIWMTPGTSVVTGQQASGTVDGSNTSFAFTGPVGATPAVLVFVAGVYQALGNDYSVASGGAGIFDISFEVAPAQGPITVVQFG